MRGALKLNSKCTGYYWIDGSPGHWEAVNGKVIGVSKKVLVDNVGAGFIQCKVQIKASVGTRIAYVLQASKKCICDRGSISFLNVTVGRLPKFRNGKIIGGCSKKVMVT